MAQTAPIGETAARLMEMVDFEVPLGKVTSVAVICLVETPGQPLKIMVASAGVLEDAGLDLPDDLEVVE